MDRLRQYEIQRKEKQADSAEIEKPQKELRLSSSGHSHALPFSELYAPLSTSLHEIRILELHADTAPSGTALVGSLITTKLTHPDYYVALSYRWGPIDDTVSMPVRHEGNVCESCQSPMSCDVQITSNLYKALLRLYELGHHRVWVDSLCINQTDVEERSLQVRNMQLIYSKAKKVVAYVGEVEKVIAEYLKSILESTAEISTKKPSPISGEQRGSFGRRSSGWLSDNNQINQYFATASHDRQSHIRNHIDNIDNIITLIKPLPKGPSFYSGVALRNFFRQPYWARVWIIQEIAVAQQVDLLYGGVVLSWEAMADSLKAATQAHNPWAHFRFPPELLSHAQQIVNLRHKYERGDSITLFDAIRWTDKSLATIPRDKIFALLGLSSDGSKLVPLPNYAQPFDDLAADMTVEMMKREKSLDLICLGGLSGLKSGPSWVPDWTNLWSEDSSKTLLETRILDRRSACPYSLRVYMDAPGILRVKGVFLGVIKTISNPMGYERVKLERREFNEIYFAPPRDRWNLHASIKAEDTTVALCLGHLGSDVFGVGDATSKSIRACFAALWTPMCRGIVRDPSMIRWLDQNATLDMLQNFNLAQLSRLQAEAPVTTKLPKFFKEDAPYTMEQLQEFVERITEVLSSGLNLMATELEEVGMVPPAARKGDELYYIRGCSVPVLLRPIPSASDIDGPSYTVVGASYVYWNRCKTGDIAQGQPSYMSENEHLLEEIKDINLH